MVFVLNIPFFYQLELYALYKQATEGKNTKPKPSAMDFVGKYKWQAWSKVISLICCSKKNDFTLQCNKLCPFLAAWRYV